MTILGYQVSSLKAYLTTPYDVLTTFRKLRDIGYRHLQIQWIDPAVPFEFTKESLQETGLTCIATQDGFTEIRNNLERYINMNVLWNSRSLCVSTIPKNLMNPEGIPIFCEEMKQIAEILDDKGIALTFHPVGFNYERISGVNAVDIVMEKLPEEIGLTLCIYHAIKVGVDPVAMLERYKGRVNICHYKDFDVFPDGKEHLVPVGQGQIDWAPIFEACRRTGVKWGLAEQESWQKDAFICAKESFDYILNWGITSPLYS